MTEAQERETKDAVMAEVARKLDTLDWSKIKSVDGGKLQFTLIDETNDHRAQKD